MFNNKKNDPLVDAVRSVMTRGEAERRVQEQLNNDLGIESKRALPHEYHAQYDVVLKEAIDTELNEISKKVLGSYVKKASADSADEVAKGMDKHASRDHKGVGYHFVKSFKRQRGIDKAVDRLVKEEEQLDEKSLSKRISRAIEVNTPETAANALAGVNKDRKKRGETQKLNFSARKLVTTNRNNHLKDGRDVISGENRYRDRKGERYTSSSMDVMDDRSNFRSPIKESSYDKDLDETKPVVVHGVKGAKSKPFSKKFKHMDAYSKWADTDEAGDYEVHRVENVQRLSEEGRLKSAYKTAKDFAPALGAATAIGAGYGGATSLGAVKGAAASVAMTTAMAAKDLKKIYKGYRNKLDEVADTPKGKDKLRSYITKAVSSAAQNGLSLGYADKNNDAEKGEKHKNRIHNRIMGVSRASRRIVKEGVDLKKNQLDEAKTPRVTKRTPKASLSLLAKREDDIGDRARAEQKKRLKQERLVRFDSKSQASKKLHQHLTGQKPLDDQTAKKIIKTLEIHPSSTLGMTIKKAAKPKKPRAPKQTGKDLAVVNNTPDAGPQKSPALVRYENDPDVDRRLADFKAKRAEQNGIRRLGAPPSDRYLPSPTRADDDRIPRPDIGKRAPDAKPSIIKRLIGKFIKEAMEKRQ